MTLQVDYRESITIVLWEVFMASEELLKKIEERLSRLEAGGFSGQLGGWNPPGGVTVDPPPWGGGWTPRWPPIPIPWPVDPAPWGGSWGSQRWPIPIPFPGDPSPIGGGIVTGGPIRPPIGSGGDPPPIDLSRFNINQLESTLHTINSERARLESLEKLVKDQIGRMEKG